MSMETWDAIRARRNVRAYTDQGLARGEPGARFALTLTSEAVFPYQGASYN